MSLGSRLLAISMLVGVGGLGVAVGVFKALRLNRYGSFHSIAEESAMIDRLSVLQYEDYHNPMTLEQIRIANLLVKINNEK
ncbi:hypothetical protein CCP3SC1AL1_990009 [Gammaproteobacteria bacterium]